VTAPTAANPREAFTGLIRTAEEWGLPRPADVMFDGALAVLTVSTVELAADWSTALGLRDVEGIWRGWVVRLAVAS
jgi:hypothetical protein